LVRIPTVPEIANGRKRPRLPSALLRSQKLEKGLDVESGLLEDVRER